MTRTRVINAEELKNIVVTIISGIITGSKLIYVPLEEVKSEESEEPKKESEGKNLKS
jgi:hypothetical protein